MKRLFRIFAVVAMVLAPAAAHAAATLPPAAQTTIDRVERYLNAIRSLKSHFLQTTSTGGQAEGELYLLRPGRMRLDYQPPAQMQVFADGAWLIFIDRAMQQETRVPLASSPAGLLVRGNIALSGDLTVTGMDETPESLRIGVALTDDPDAGTVVLVFDKDPLTLREWQVTDPQGVTSRVALVDPVFNVPIDPQLLVPVIPPFYTTTD